MKLAKFHRFNYIKKTNKPKLVSSKLKSIKLFILSVHPPLIFLSVCLMITTKAKTTSVGLNHRGSFLVLETLEILHVWIVAELLKWWALLWDRLLNIHWRGFVNVVCEINVVEGLFGTDTLWWVFLEHSLEQVHGQRAYLLVLWLAKVKVAGSVLVKNFVVFLAWENRMAE